MVYNTRIKVSENGVYRYVEVTKYSVSQIRDRELTRLEFCRRSLLEGLSGDDRRSMSGYLVSMKDWISEFVGEDDDLLLELKIIYNRMLNLGHKYLPEEVEEYSPSYRSLLRTRTQIFDIVRSNSWDYFVTLTISPEICDRHDYDAVLSKVRKFLNNFIARKYPLKYILIPELHVKGGYHFHGLFSGDISKYLRESVNPRNKKKIKHNGNQVYNFLDYKLGYSTLTQIIDTDKAANYIIKYMTKELHLAVPKGKRRFINSKGLNMPEEFLDHVSDFESVLYPYENLLKSFDRSFTLPSGDVQDINISTYKFNL